MTTRNHLVSASLRRNQQPHGRQCHPERQWRAFADGRTSKVHRSSTEHLRQIILGNVARWVCLRRTPQTTRPISHSSMGGRFRQILDDVAASSRDVAMGSCAASVPSLSIKRRARPESDCLVGGVPALDGRWRCRAWSLKPASLRNPATRARLRV